MYQPLSPEQIDAAVASFVSLDAASNDEYARGMIELLSDLTAGSPSVPRDDDERREYLTQRTALATEIAEHETAGRDLRARLDRLNREAASATDEWDAFPALSEHGINP